MITASASTQSTSSSIQPALPPSLRVLVVEDQPSQRAQMLEGLSQFGVTAMTAATSSEAIQIAASSRPDVIFIDGLLPGMHGFEVARFIRGMAVDYHPFLVITTAIYKNLRYRNEAHLKYGIDMYLVKPVSPENLRAALQRGQDPDEIEIVPGQDFESHDVPRGMTA